MAGYALRSKFDLGYRNKEDISTLPAQVLVVGSQNVLTNAADQVAIRQGYALDGPAGTQNSYGIDSAYDFSNEGGVKNLRKWGSTLQVRYQNPVSDAVTWISLLTTLQAINPARFTDFWDYSTEKKELCIFGNGDNNLFEWTGAVGSIASVSNANGIISAITQPNSESHTSGGAGYIVGDVLTVSGGDGAATLQVLSVSPGGVASSHLGLAGAGYAANDLFSITSGATLKAIFKVLTVSGGAILTYQQMTAGVSFLAGGTYSIAAVTGAGSGGTIVVDTIGNTITAWQLLTNGTTYSAANNVALTGGTGSGATLEIVSVGQYAITVSGSLTLSQLGFYDNSANSTKFKIKVNGTELTYTTSNANGGFALVGLSVDPTTLGVSAGDAVVQSVFFTTAQAVSSLPTTFNFDLLATIKNQVYYGDLGNNTVYVTKANSYTDVSFSSPRLPGEGALFTMDAPPVGFKAQSSQGDADPSVMYIAAGRNKWYASSFPLSADLTKEAVSFQQLKTTQLQGAQSQELISDFKNTITFVSNEPQLNEFGIQADYFAEPQMVNISDPIKYDMDAYEFTGGAVDYDNYYLYVLVPANGVMRLYNLAKKYWEAPQTLPIARLYRVDGVLYGHSSLTDESYQLFTGYNDNGNPINAVAAFPYVAAIEKVGEPDDLKASDRQYTEGYIAGNTELTLTINYDFGGFSGSYSGIINGQPAIGGQANPIIFNRVTDGSLGNNTLGSQPIGTILNLGNQPANPKFRVINTMPKHDFFESQIVYSSNDVDQQWALLRFGPLIQPSVNKPTFITQ